MSALKIPKSLGKSWVTLDDPLIFPMTLLTLDADRIMVRFMELALRMGYLTKALSVVTESTYNDLFLEDLVNDHRIFGLSNSERREVLDGWIRAALIEPERSGMGRDKERRIAYIKPVTLGVIRAGLPRGTYMIRHADIWAYRLCLEELELRGISNKKSQLRETVHKALGEGIEMSRQSFQSDEPVYDEKTDIDITALLAMRLLSRFTDARPGDEITPGKAQEIWPTDKWNEDVRKDSKHISGITPKELKLKLIGPEPMSPIEQLIAIPNAFLPLGRDLFDLLSNYGQSISHTELTQHCIGLTALRLFQAPLRVARGLQILETLGHTENSSKEKNPLEMYCDFTNSSVKGSVELAKSCVRRDIEIHHELLRGRLQLRALSWIGDLIMDRDARDRLKELRSVSIASYYKELLVLKDDPMFEQAGLLKLHQFQTSLDSENEEHSELWKKYIKDWEDSGLKSYEIVLQILRTAYNPGSRAPAQHFQWFWTSGGLLNTPPHRSYALLAGSVKHKSTWRYSPTDSLLMSMLMACFVQSDGEHQWVETELRLTEVIRRFEDRFGVLIDRPPLDFLNADSQRIALINKQAFVRKLQLLGCFEGLSDDPDYQLVNRPRKANDAK